MWAGDVTGTIYFGSTEGSTKIQGSSSAGSGKVTYTDTGNDSQSNSWTITTITSKSKSFTQNAAYSQVGSSSNAVTSITFTTTLSNNRTIKAFSAKFGGFSNTDGDVTLKVGSTTVGSGTLNGTNDVTVSATNTTTSGTQLTVTVTNIIKGVKCYYISYTYEDGATLATVETPVLSLASGTYPATQNVAISCGTDGAAIYYTMTEDGSTPDDPTENDVTYTSALSVTKSGTKIKARAFKNGLTASAVASATYTIKPSKPTITAAGATITITAGDGCNIYYTTDNTEPTTSSSHYTGSFNLNTSCKIKARAYDTYNNASDISPYDFYYWPLEPKNINSNYFVKVTDVSTLENGDAILIVSESENSVAMSTTQNTNNRGQADIAITNSIIDSPLADVQKLVLMKIGNYFYFHTGSGYLYAASSSSNNLKTEDTPDDDDNAKATIAISEGNATITFQGKNTRNIIKHNGTNSLFSCYQSSSSQEAVQIYKEVPREPAAPTTSGDVTYLTTSDNMAGWRAFYDASNSYSVDGNTKVYVADADPVGTTITLTAIAGIPANVPVILHTSSSADSHKMTLTKETEAPYTYTNDNKLSWETTAVTDKYRLGFGASGVGFYPYSGTPTSGAVILNVDSSTSGARELTIGFEDETTSLNEELRMKNEKYNAIYNLAGQRVAQPTRGLYIVNGKKVIIK